MQCSEWFGQYSDIVIVDHHHHQHHHLRRRRHHLHHQYIDQVMRPAGDWGDTEEVGVDIEPDRKLRSKSEHYDNDDGSDDD